MAVRTIRKLGIGASPKAQDFFQYAVSSKAGDGTVHSIKFRDDLFYTKNVILFEIWVLVPNPLNSSKGDISLWKDVKFGEKDSYTVEYELNF